MTLEQIEETCAAYRACGYGPTTIVCARPEPGAAATLHGALPVAELQVFSNAHTLARSQDAATAARPEGMSNG